jgi:molecular chaperone DnaJ
VTCGRCRGAGYEVQSQGFFAVRSACGRCGGEGVEIVDPCRACGATGLVVGKREVSVKVPAGVEDGIVLRVRGEGEAGVRGGPRGDLHCVLRVREHDLFVRSPRDPADLFVEVPVPLGVALLGGEVVVPTLDGTANVQLDAGTEPGATLKVRGEGLPRLQRAGRGDLYVRVAYDVPQGPGRKVRKALEAFREAEAHEPGPRQKKFARRLDQHRAERERNSKDEASS